jgi:hypothetical protein
MKVKFNFFRKFMVLSALAAMLFVQSCNDDPKVILKPGAAGFFVVNEGTNTSISFYDRETEEMTNDVFIAKNGIPLGIQAQSMTVFEGKGYIVVQGSGKIEVIDADDYSSLATISEELPSPRYFVGISTTKAYVSDWGADGVTGSVKVLNLTTNEVTKTIPTGQGANRMLKVGNLVYVANAGGYGNDNTIKILDTTTDEIVNTITTGDNPNGMLKDNDGNIWVTSGGAIKYNDDFSIDEENSTTGSISKITANNTEAFRLPVDVITYNYPNNLNISPDGTTLYYTYNGAVYSMSTSATALPTTHFKDKDYYGLSVDPFNGNIIGCNAGNFVSAGSIDIYDAAGTIQDTFTVGIGPNGCAFK